MDIAGQTGIDHGAVPRTHARKPLAVPVMYKDASVVDDATCAASVVDPGDATPIDLDRLDVTE